ncbi:MAG: TonB-dependent receptor, partial [bacterium]
MLVSSATAQGVDVRGVVTDSSNGQRIPFANISVIGTRLGVSTNLNGFFLITNVPPGKYVMVASAIGYAHIGQTVEIRGREPITVNFILSPQAVEVSEVITEGTQSPEKATATSIHVFGSKEIQDIPVAGAQDVLRAIQILPGIVSSSDVSAKFFVRGGAGDQNLILLDGMKMYNPFHAFGIFSVFDPDIISTAEVFTGAFPAGYGNRLSSVINLTTKAGNTTRFSGKGELNFLNAKVQLEGPINEDNSWLVNYRTSLSSNVFKHFLRTSIPVSFYDVFFKGTLGGATGRNSLRAFFSGDKITSDRPDEPDYSWDNYSIAGSLSGLAYDRVYVDAFAYSSSFRVKRDPKHSAIILPAESRVGDDGLRVEFTVHTESQNVWLAGFQFDLPEYEFTYATASNSNRTFRGTDPELWLWGRYQLHFGALQTDLGIHSDVLTVLDNGLSLQGFQPRVSLVYQLSNAWRTKFGAGVYNQRVITISNEDDITSLFDAWISIPKELKFEEAHHYVFGVEGMIV